MKTYTLTITIKEGSDEFWEELEGKTGCDEVVDEVKACLQEHGFYPPEAEVRLTRFETSN